MSIFIGTYLKFTKQPEFVLIEEKKCCNNVDCVRFDRKSDFPFCSSCGQKNIVVKTNSTKTVDLMNETNEKFGNVDIFYTDGGDVATPNAVPEKLKPYILYLYMSDEEKETDIPDKILSIQIFKEVYENYLKFLTENGYEFQIKFGIVNKL